MRFSSLHVFIRSSATRPLFLVKIVHIIFEFLQYLFIKWRCSRDVAEHFGGRRRRKGWGWPAAL